MVRQVLMYEVVGLNAAERLQTLRAPSTETVPNTFLIFCRKLPLLPTMLPNFFHNFQRSTSWSGRSLFTVCFSLNPIMKENNFSPWLHNYCLNGKTAAPHNVPMHALQQKNYVDFGRRISFFRKLSCGVLCYNKVTNVQTPEI